MDQLTEKDLVDCEVLARAMCVPRPQKILALCAEVRRLRAHVEVDEKLLVERNRLLDLFECPVHGGGCIPHAIEAVKRLRADLTIAHTSFQNAQEEMRRLQSEARAPKEVAPARKKPGRPPGKAKKKDA